MQIEQLIIADRLAGTGINENGGRGYQPAAKSAGLDKDCINFLSTFCPHYGQAVKIIDSACNDAISWAQKEGEKPEEQRSKQIPDYIANNFPVSWNYTPLPDNLFAISRICYAFSCENRPGSFIAHSIVCHPEMLAPVGFNPLALTHADIFWKHDQPEVIQLPALEKFSPRKNIDGTFDILTKPPIKDKLINIISALASEYPVTRPVVLCLPDWKSANEICEALLDTLPPTRRCRTGVSTFESDFKWKPGSAGDRKSLHDLIILGTNENQQSSIKAFDYQQNEYSIFNFVDNKFSELPEACSYAAFAAKCVLNNDYHGLQKFQNFCEELDFGSRPEVIDALVAVEKILNPQATPDELCQCVKILQEKCDTPKQISYIINLSLPFIKSFFENNKHEEIARLASESDNLYDRMPENDLGLVNDFISEAKKLIETAIAQGKWRLSGAVAQCFAKQYKEIMFEALCRCIASSELAVACSPDNGDIDKMAEVTKFACLHLDQNNDHKISKCDLLVSMFKATKKARCTESYWKLVAPDVVIPFLQDNFNAAGELVNELLSICRDEHIADACVWIKFLKISHSALDTKQLVDDCIEIVNEGTGCSECANVIVQLPELLQKNISQEAELALALGQIANPASQYPEFDLLFEQYQMILKKLPPESMHKIRKELIDRQCFEVVSREIIKDMEPWSLAKKECLLSWKESILDNNARILEKIYGELAAQIYKGNVAAIELAECIVPDELSSKEISGQLTKLLQEVALHLTLAPLSRKWLSIFDKLQQASSFSDNVKNRIEIMQFMTKVNDEAKQQEWNITKFPLSGSSWKKLRNFPPQEKNKAVRWCQSLLNGCGIQNPEAARHFINILDCAGIDSSQEIASLIIELTNSRDLVTTVQVISAFYDIEYSENSEALNIVKAVILKCDDRIASAFKQHLKLRFGHENENSRKKFERIFPAPAKLPASRENPEIPRRDKSIFTTLLNIFSKK